MTARNKLHEENQMLRDKLQDAEMFILLLQQKLKESTGSTLLLTEVRESPEKRAALRFCRHHGDIEATRGMLSMKFLGKNSYKNAVAPGKKTFTVSTENSSSLGTHRPISRLGHRQELLQGQHVSVLNAQNVGAPSFVEISKSKTRKSKRGMPALHNHREVATADVATVFQSCAPSFGEGQFPGNSEQRRSIIGKLAQVVINEYSDSIESNDSGF